MAPADPAASSTGSTPHLSDEQRERLRRNATLDTYRELGVLTEDVDAPDDGEDLDDVEALMGAATSAYRHTDIPDALIRRATHAQPAVLIQRLQAASEQVRRYRDAERSANDAAAALALSLHLYDGVPHLHVILGTHRTPWRRRVVSHLDVSSDWYSNASAADLTARARAVGITHYPGAREELVPAVEHLIDVQARWTAARRVRDILIRHLYPGHLNQPGVQKVSGLTQAQVWQILNPTFRRKT
jgi:hypothetical protein